MRHGVGSSRFGRGLMIGRCAFHIAPQRRESALPAGLVALQLGSSHAGLAVPSRHWRIRQAPPPRGLSPQGHDGTRVPTRQPGPLAGPGPLRGQGGLTTARVAFRRPRSAILGPVRASASPLPCRSTRAGSTWGRLIRPVEAVATHDVAAARATTIGRQGLLDLAPPTGRAFQAPATATSGVGSKRPVGGSGRHMICTGVMGGDKCEPAHPTAALCQFLPLPFRQ
jgi:hypothetical protein